MGAWTVPAIVSVVLSVVPDLALARIMVAAVLTESGGDPMAVGDNGASRGWYQIHDVHGLDPTIRHDPRASTVWMYEHEFAPAYDQGRQYGYHDEVLAMWTYLRAERPAGYRSPEFPGWTSPAAAQFRLHWYALEGAVTEYSAVESWVAVMRSLFGVPYVWGGKYLARDGGFDCSGLLTYAARQVGLDLGDPDYTDADALRRASTPLAEPRRGALACFHSTYGRAGPGYTTHVGVVLAPGRMVDTHDPRGVGETVIAGAWWQEHLQGYYWHPALGQTEEDEAVVDELRSLLGYLTHDVHDAILSAWQDAKAAHADRLAARSTARRRAADERWSAAAEALEAALATLRRGGSADET